MLPLAMRICDAQNTSLGITEETTPPGQNTIGDVWSTRNTPAGACLPIPDGPFKIVASDTATRLGRAMPSLRATLRGCCERQIYRSGNEDSAKWDAQMAASKVTRKDQELRGPSGNRSTEREDDSPWVDASFLNRCHLRNTRICHVDEVPKLRVAKHRMLDVAIDKLQRPGHTARPVDAILGREHGTTQKVIRSERMPQKAWLASDL